MRIEPHRDAFLVALKRNEKITQRKWEVEPWYSGYLQSRCL